MAAIEKRGNSYRIIVSSGYDSAGKQQKVSLTYTPKETAPSKVKKELQTVAVDFERRVKEGSFISGDRTTFASFVHRWIDDYASDRDNLGQKNYEESIRVLSTLFIPAFGHLTLNQIKAPHLMDVYKQLEREGKSAKTIRKMHSIVSSVFSLAYDYAMIQDNPCGRCRLPKDKNPYKYTVLDESQLKHFIAALDTEYRKKSSGYLYKDENGRTRTGYTWTSERIDTMFRLYFILALNTGARRGELCALVWSDIDFDSHIMHITKAIEYTKANGITIKPPKTQCSIRDIPLNSKCISMLKVWRSEEMQLSFTCGSDWEGYTGKKFDQNYIFIQQGTGRMMHVQTPADKMSKMIKAYNEMHGEELIPKIRLHDLRHTFATHSIAAGADIITVSKILGHSSPSVTLDVYCNHTLPEKAPEVTDLFEKICFS